MGGRKGGDFSPLNNSIEEGEEKRYFGGEGERSGYMGLTLSGMGGGGCSHSLGREKGGESENEFNRKRGKRS